MELIEKLKAKYEELKNFNLDENSMFKEFYDFLGIELDKLSRMRKIDFSYHLKEIVN